MTQTRRHRRWPWILLVIGVLLVGLFYIGGGWYFSSLIHSDALKANPYDPDGFWKGSVQAIEGTGDRTTITVLPDAEHREETRFDSVVMGLVFDGGSVVVVGPASATGVDGSRTRPVVDVVGDMPAQGDVYRFTKEVWLTPAQAGLTGQEITIATPSGEFPATSVTVPGSNKWAVLTHGRGGDRHDMLRMARPLHAAGYNLLLTTFAGDNLARPAEDGIWHFGVTEWDEIEAQVQYALDQGAQTLVMGALSLGGAVTDGFLVHSSLAEQVDGVILDAPLSSLRDSIDEGAESRRFPLVGLPIPESLEDVAMLIAGLRFGVDYDAIDYSDMDGLIDVPLLTFQTSEDQTIPQPVNDHFMTEGSGQGGEYIVVPGVGHVLSWNAGPPAYEQAVTDFVAQLG
jgi:pimeloyl-ACP methyl ester carboxylesterase